MYIFSPDSDPVAISSPALPLAFYLLEAALGTTFRRQPKNRHAWEKSQLVVKNDIQKGTVDLQPTVVVDETQLPEAVQEEIHSGAGGADHLCQSRLTDLGNDSLWLSLLAEVSQQEKDPRSSLFARIEKLVDQILFVTDVPAQQIGHEHVGHPVFAMKRQHHDLLI